MSTKDQTQKLLDQVNQEVAQLGNAERRRVLIAVRQAEEELSVALEKWLREAPGGAERFTAQHYRKALIQLRSIRTVWDTTGKALKESLHEAGSRASIMSYEHIQQEWTHFNQIFDDKISPLPLDVVSELSNPDRGLLKRFDRMAKAYSKETRAWLHKQLAVGVLKGETFDQMTSRIVKLGAKRAADASLPLSAQMAHGILTYPRHRVSRIVRTEVMRAYNIGHQRSVIALAKNDPEVVKRWDSSLDRRGCQVCRSLDGEVRKPTEKFSTGIQYPPQHPHCRCTVVAWKEHWDHPSLPSEGTEEINPVIQPGLVPAGT